jgi:hypothetical protein
VRLAEDAGVDFCTCGAGALATALGGRSSWTWQLTSEWSGPVAADRDDNAGRHLGIRPHPRRAARPPPPRREQTCTVKAMRLSAQCLFKFVEFAIYELSLIEAHNQSRAPGCARTGVRHAPQAKDRPGAAPCRFGSGGTASNAPSKIPVAAPPTAPTQLGRKS